MPQRHSKNNNDLAFFTYDEKRKLGYGTQKERLGKDSIKPFDACCLCLKPLIDPMCCQKGHVFCKECILECLLAQKKDIQRKLAAHAAQQKQDKEEEEEKLMLQKARELEAFDQQNHSAVPQYSDKNYNKDKNSFHGANSVKTTSYEEEALRTMKAFWLPSATPEARAKFDAPPTSTICPEGKENLKLKTLFPIYFTEDSSDDKKNRVLLTGPIYALAASKGCKERNLIPLQKGGTGFAGHDDHLLATDFKHLGSGSGLGLVRPAMKT
ncbi:phosphoinositide binding protein [Actinidia rufa]|uniref:Phosphoinositide binding protein n=1 Tax=Actinidia rufa TaxID=165716 RepID=A0A7J0G654_9ERIC|nr:phosphoinositide binding protein [Actinidia rufa]